MVEPILPSLVVFLQELDKQIVDYTSTYEPDDQLEWSLVLEEIKSFIKADGIVNVIHADSNTVVLSHRYVFFVTVLLRVDIFRAYYSSSWILS